MQPNKLKKILDKHLLYLQGKPTGERANLSGADLQSANLERANLQSANLRGANLQSANLRGADLQSANLRGADLQSANLQSANLSCANLSCANLRSANLSGANLYGANLTDVRDLGQFIRVPKEGTFIAYKKADGFIIKLGIPKSAKRVNCIGSFKCRCDKAKVLGIYTQEGTLSSTQSVKSNWDCNFIYTVGKTVVVPDYNPSDRVECSSGIHFFMTFEEAKEY